MDVVEVWPDNWDVAMFFGSIPPGAWNYAGMAGIRAGLRPEALREIRLSLGITGQRWREMYPDLLVMESAALEFMHQQRQENNRG